MYVIHLLISPLNGLEVLEEIVPISARLIANKASYKFKKDSIQAITKSL